MNRVLRLMIFFIVMMSIGLLFAFGWLCWLQASSFVNVPTVQFPWVLADFGIDDAQDFAVETSDEITIRGFYVAPTRDDGATFIFLHGHAGRYTDLAPEAQYLIEQGFGAVLYDARGRGLSDSAPVTMGVNEVRDVEAILDFLLEQPEVNPQRIAVYGNSMGASTAILATAHLSNIQLVIADAPYTSIRDAVADGIPATIGIPPLFFPQVIVAMSSYISGADYGLASPMDALDDISQPILFIHGTLDTTIQYHHSERLYATANNPKALYLVEGGGHTNNFDFDRDGWQAVVMPFLDAHLTN